MAKTTVFWSGENNLLVYTEFYNPDKGEFDEITFLNGVETVVDSFWIDLEITGYENLISHIEILKGGVEIDFTLNISQEISTVRYNGSGTALITINIYFEGGGTGKDLGYNNVYFFTPEEMKTLFKEQFIFPDAVPPIDLSDYIINLIEIPFSVDESYLLSEESIILESYLMQTISTRLNDDVLTLDFGAIEIPLTFNNSFDFIDTEIVLHLPYSNSVELDVNYVVGCEIGVVYHIDLYNGETTINISSSKIGKVIESNSVNVSKEIPYVNRHRVLKEVGVFRGVKNDVEIPYIEVVRNVIREENIFENQILDSGILNNVTGFVVVDNIQLNSKFSLDDERQIINLLSNGVFIK